KGWRKSARMFLRAGVLGPALAARPRAGEVARVHGIGAIAIAPAVRRRLGLLGEPAQALARAVAVLRGLRKQADAPAGAASQRSGLRPWRRVRRVWSGPAG